MATRPATAGASCELSTPTGFVIDVWDHIIIGAGSAGCVVANRLSDDRSKRVLVLEAGGADWSPYIRIPVGVSRMPRKYNWAYPGEPDGSRAGAVDTWSAGRVLGGSSSINGMLWVRGNPQDFDRWSALGCEGWDYESMLPYFRAVETYEGGANRYRGDSGRLHVSNLRVSHASIDAFINSAIAAGIAPNEDYNGARQGGVAQAQFTHRRGWRHSTASAFLAPARRRSNLKVRTGAIVTRILFEQGRAVGVEYRRRGRLLVARCRGEVVLSAGSIASPKILLLSGVGPADTLRAHGIGIVADSPNVGQGLQEHLYTIMTHLLNIPTLTRELTPRGVLGHGVRFVVQGRGAATSSFAAVIAFDHAEPSAEPPQFELLFAPYGLAESEQTATVTSGRSTLVRHDIHDVQLAATNIVTTLPSILEPGARGSVSIRSSDPDSPPLIRHELAAEAKDLQTLIAACRRTRDIFSCEPLRTLVVRESAPGDSVQSDADWERYLRSTTFGGSHPVGTCGMGSDSASVVDSSLAVRGVTGLRVIDASVMPVISRGNTNAPTVAIAARGADLIVAGNARGRSTS